MITGVPDPLDLAARLARALLRRLLSVDSLPASIDYDRAARSRDGGAVPFRWESDMLEPVAEAFRKLAPWLTAPGAIVAEIPAAVGIVDLVGVRFNQRSLRHRDEAALEPTLSPLRVRVLHGLLDGRPKDVEYLAGRVGSRPEALMRSTLRPLERADLIELGTDTVRSTGVWLPAADRVVAVELKLSKWRGALAQADNFTRSADEAWVVLDAARSAGAALAVHEFVERGVGLAVATSDGELDVLAAPARTRPEGWLHALIGERALAATKHAAVPAEPGAPARLPSEPRTVALVA